VDIQVHAGFFGIQEVRRAATMKSLSQMAQTLTRAEAITALRITTLVLALNKLARKTLNKSSSAGSSL
jgi:hypothetical protein